MLARVSRVYFVSETAHVELKLDKYKPLEGGRRRERC